MNRGLTRALTPQEALEWRKKLPLNIALDRESAESLGKAGLETLIAYTRDAEIYLWDKAIALTAASHCAIGTTVRDIWQRRAELHIWNWNQEFKDKNWVKDYGCLATLILPDADALRVGRLDLFSVHGSDMVEPYSGSFITDGDIVESDDVQFIVSLLSFVKTSLAVKERPSFNRAARRQLERQNIDHSKIQVITLRKGEPHEPKGTRQVEWSCQWDVKPFYGIRHTKEGPKRVLISGHRKGPEGKPLKERGEVVSIVKR